MIKEHIQPEIACSHSMLNHAIKSQQFLFKFTDKIPIHLENIEIVPINNLVHPRRYLHSL